VFETSEEIATLQGLLDLSHGRATEHLHAIMKPERTLRATEIVGLLTGMRTISLATVTAKAEARISAVDGHLLHGGWVFSTSVGSAKARQLAARPGVSTSYLEGEDLGVFTHGRAHRVAEDDPAFEPTLSYLTDHYGSSPLTWGDTAIYRLEPTWMIGYAFRREALLADRGVAREPRDEDVT
jgi:hypothetical protein